MNALRPARSVLYRIDYTFSMPAPEDPSGWATGEGHAEIEAPTLRSAVAYLRDWFIGTAVDRASALESIDAVTVNGRTRHAYIRLA